MADRDATTLRRGIEILLQLGSDEAVEAGGMRVVQLARNIGQDKSQVSRTLKTLAQAGLADRAPGAAGYRLGWRVYELAARGGDRRLLQAAPPVLARLVRESGEPAHLSVLRGNQVLTLWTEAPRETIIQATGWAGRTVPAWCTSSGRALLMDHDPDALRSAFAGTDFRGGGPNAPGDVAELSARVAEAARHGYAAAEEEFEPGLAAAAAPVRDYRGHIVAALNLSGPAYRFASRLDEAGTRLKWGALEVSRALGGAMARASRPGARASRAGDSPDESRQLPSG